MKNRVYKLFSLSAVFALSGVILTGCGGDKSTVESIKIKSGIKESYIVGEKEDYNDLSIDLLDADKKVLKNVKYSGEKDKFSIVKGVNTSVAAKDLEFKLSYLSDERTFETSVTYKVLSEGEAVEIDNWVTNSNYGSYLSKKDNAEFINNDETKANFINSEGKFYVANMNSINLIPTIYGVDASGQSTIVKDFSLMGENIISLKITDKNGSLLNLNDYFEEDSLAKILKDGTIDFKNDLGDLTREVKLSFIYDESSSTEEFPDITYDITIVDGYNITNAKELVLIDNSHSKTSYIEMKKKLNPIGLPTENSDIAKFSFENFVVANDVTIELKDLPNDLIFDATRDGSDPVLNGSLKDWEYMYNHNHVNKESSEFNIYGNYNKISLGATFPYVLTENRDGTAMDESNTVINTHTTLFGSETYKESNELYTISYNDLSVTGNQGVGASQADEEGVVRGGILFNKNTQTTEFNNTVINNFFTVHINVGPWKPDIVTENSFPIINVTDSKIFDCFSAALFSYRDGDINVNHSIIKNAGGPLFISQATEYVKTTDNDWTTVPVEKRHGTHLTSDKDSILENFVTGDAGWFNIYGASSAIANLKSLDQLFKANSKTFLKTVGNTPRFNCIAISMNSDATSAGPLKGSMISSVNLAGKEYLNYVEGKEKMDKDFGNGTTTLNQSEFTKDLYSTHYGATYMAEGLNESGLPLFVTNVEENAFTTVKANSSGQVDGLIPLKKYVDSSSTTDLGADFGGKYVGTYIYLNTNIKGLSSAAEIIKKYPSFIGTSAYGLVMEIMDI